MFIGAWRPHRFVSLTVMASRSEASRSAILEATIDLLNDTTVQKLSIEAIAKRAGVGKTTIYRWWPSKAAVVIDAFMEHHLVKTPIPEDVPVREALTTHLRSLIRQYRGPSGRLVAQIIAESQYDPSTLADFKGRFWEGRRAAITHLVKRGMEEGEIRDDIDPDLIVEMLYAPVYLRLLFGHKPLTERYAEQAIAVAFAGVGTAAAVAS
jgi:AcrR family transcriptional regulator